MTFGKDKAAGAKKLEGRVTAVKFGNGGFAFNQAIVNKKIDFGVLSNEES